MDTRSRILNAAISLAQDRDSLTGVTVSMEAVAQAADLTKPGLFYHFPTKQALMEGLVQIVAERWDTLLNAEAGGTPYELTPFDRHRAYVNVATTAAVSRGDYWVFTGALYHPSLRDTWEKLLRPWFVTEGVSPPGRALLTTARFCADGAWMSEATTVFPAHDLDAVRDCAQELVDRAERDEAS